MEAILKTDTELEFTYTDAEERTNHVTELLQHGWVLTNLSGSSVMTAKFKREDKIN